MKKVLLAAVILGGLSLVSCKKDYTCTCTTTDDGEVFAESSTTINATKGDAEDACNTETSSGDFKTVCEIED